MVAAAGIPNERCALGLRVMEAGKDYFVDKTPMTTLAHVEAAKECCARTGRRYFVYFSERLHNESSVLAGNLVMAGEIGDVIQLGRNGVGYYHTLLVVGFEGQDTLIAAQTDDALDRPLSSYTNDYARYIKIEGVRFEMPDDYSCFEKVYNVEPIQREPSTVPPADPLPQSEPEGSAENNE